VSRLAKEERVSGSLVRRSFTEETRCQWGIDELRPKTSRVIGLDEFSAKKRTFDTTTSDLEERKVLGIVEGCGNPTYHNY